MIPLKANGWKFISLLMPKIVHRGIARSYDHRSLLKDGKWHEEWGIK